MSAPIRITVAIPTYNRANFLRQILSGLAGQDYAPAGFEVLVVDNNSTDETRAVVEEFAGAATAPRYIQEPTQGLNHARNRAIAEARGEIVVFADDDILVPTDWLTNLTGPIESDALRRIGAVGGEVIPVFPDGVPGWVSHWHRPLKYREEAGPISKQPMGANLAFPKWVFERLGLFEPTLDRCAKYLFDGGDGDMIRRVRAAGLEVWFAPAARVEHQIPASRTSLRYNARHAFDSARSRVIARVREGGAAAFLLTRFVANVTKAIGCGALALAWGLVLQSGKAKQALVRGCRAVGYVYQSMRSLLGLRPF